MIAVKIPSPLREIMRQSGYTVRRHDGGPGSGPRAGYKRGGSSVAVHTTHAPDTKDAFFKDGKWAPERVAIHEAYSAKVAKGVPGGKVPTVYLTGGGPASGKSSALLRNPEAGIPGPTRAVHSDSDAAKTFLPEYQQGVRSNDLGAAAKAHRESSHMSGVAISDAIAKGQDIVYDSTGDNGIEVQRRYADHMRKMGVGRIEASYATVDVETAIARSDARASQTGRFVPHEEIRRSHADVAKTALDAMDQGVFDSLKLFDTSGSSPRLIASYDRATGRKVHDEIAFARHVARAGR